MKCLVFSKTFQFGFNTSNTSNTIQPHQPKINITTNEKITIRPLPLM